jgi:transcription antitermination factor NusG
MLADNKNWYAVYTKSRAEKKLHSELCSKNITSFLPIKKEIKQWSDRKKWVEQPLLPSYLFVKISTADHFNVLNTPGAVRYVSFEGKPAPIPEKQIIFLQTLLSGRPSGIEVDYSHIEPGMFVEVVSGPLKGVAGEVMQLNGKYRLLLRFESIRCCVHAEISMSEVSHLKRREPEYSTTF